MRNFMKVMSMSVAIFLSPLAAQADSPPSTTTPDSHSIENKGTVNLYRVQSEGLEFGKGKDAIDAEVMVTLDSDPTLVYTIRLHEDSPKSALLMAETLRDAFINSKPVSIFYQIAPGKKYLKIMTVQMIK